MMQPRQAHFGDRAGTSADHDAGIASESHHQISCIAHAAWDQYAAWPILKVDVVRRNDADDESSCSECSFGRNASGRTSTTAYDCDARLCERFTCSARELISGRTGLRASENADLASSTGQWVQLAHGASSILALRFIHSRDSKILALRIVKAVCFETRSQHFGLRSSPKRDREERDWR
jgi:hypothetical protein